MRTLRISVAGLALLTMAGAARAQNNAWYNPYVKGVRAVESARYAEGVTLLERAVAEDPRAARNKYIEGVFRTDYVPYFYLAIAYTRLGQFDRAAANATKAAVVVPPDLAARFSDLRRELDAKPATVAAARRTAPTPQAAPAPSSVPSARQAEADALKGDVITTSGQASVRRPPDVAFLTIGVETRAKSPRDAQRQNADETTAMQRRLNDAGVSRDALRTLGIDLQQEFDFNQGRRTPRDYVARNTIEVRVDDVGRVGELVDVAVQGGATSTGGVRFDLRDRSTAERDAVRLAVADARARAEAAAAGAGRALGRILKIEENREDTIVMARPMFAAAAAQAAPAPTPVDPGYVEVRARVTLTASMR
jgi:uncharacterized protein